MSGGNSAGSKGSRGGGSGVSNLGMGRPGRGGWEEAGGEFYQESYPGAGELEGPKTNIATLLPSKQLRGTTVRRIRPAGERRQSTAARGTSTSHVMVSMLPDLSENLSNEESTWDEIMQIKAMPVPMAQKRERKGQLQSATKLRLQGLEQLKWKRRKVWRSATARIKEIFGKLSWWKSSFKNIEGSFGTGVVAYFYLLKWLFWLHFSISVFIVCFIVVPQAVLQKSAENDDDTCDIIVSPNSTQCCTELYFNSTNENTNFILDIIQGTGWMEKTVLFYGAYSHKIFTYYVGGTNSNLTFVNDSSGTPMYYNLPLAYILIAVLYFAMSLMAIVKSAARGFKERLVEGEGQFYQYCNIVFGGWDFCIHNEKSGNIKHKALYNEIRCCLERERLVEEKLARSREEQIKLILIRIIVNFIVICILIGAAASIFYSFNYSINELNRSMSADLTVNTTSKDLPSDYSTGVDSLNYTDISEVLVESRTAQKTTTDVSEFAMFLRMGIQEEDTISKIKEFSLQYLPSVCIVILNIMVPIVFQVLIGYENYSPAFVIKLTLFRTVFLRLSSLVVLLTQLYLLIISRNSTQCLETEPNHLLCWETYVGQQFYKLIITDFVIQVIVTFLVNFPRAMMARKTSNKCLKIFGEQEFHLPKHVLDVVYSQTLCWLGAFYCPILPLISTVLCFVMFYVKKFACLINSKPSSTVYRASKSNSLFMVVLLISFCISIIPVGYAIAELAPSRGCGPFRSVETVWGEIVETFDRFPDVLRTLVFLVGTSAFAIPVFVVLVLLLYYYWAVADANRHMVSVLKSQLVLEGHDKQFLLNRLSAFIRQQYKRNERARQHHAHTNVDDDDSIRQSSK